MAYRVKLDLFEGPLDLLLHLIKKNEVDITDIPIAVITDQYLAYLGLLEDLNLDVAGEFLVMAATLMNIKSRCLLPEPESEGGEDEEGDPRAELVERLREYQRFREAGLELSRRAVLTRDVFARPKGGQPDDPAHTVVRELRDVSLGVLLDALRDVMRRIRVAPVHEVLPEGLTIRDCVGPILNRLRATGRASFDRLFPEGATRHRVIVTFLALLELMRVGAVRAYQEEDFEEVIVVLALPSVEAAEEVMRSFEFAGLSGLEEA
jgi:segregation and condensation protein A